MQQGNVSPGGDLQGRIANLEQKLSQALGAVHSKDVFPEQQRAGVIAYPDRYPYSMVLTSQVSTASGGFFGVDTTTCRALLQVDIDNPVFLTSISFSLYKPVLAGIPQAEPVGVFLPLSGAVNDLNVYNPLLTTAPFYQGRDFEWRVRTGADGYSWQTGWRPSTQVQGEDHLGYVLPVELELTKNDTIVIEAQPLQGTLLDPPQSWILEVYLHVYKMLLKRA